MLGVMLPVVALPSLPSVHVFVVVPVKIIVVVDVHVATVPIAIAPVAAPGAPSGGTQCDSRAPRQSRPWHVTRIRIRIVRIFGRGRTVNDCRVVRGDVDNLRVGWFDLDYLLAARDCLGLHYRLGTGF